MYQYSPLFEYKSCKLQLPSVPWIMRQTWSENLFVHYPVKKENLQKLLPSSLQIDTFQDMGWVSIVPYYISNMRSHWFPPLPGVKEYAGVNLRTYVKGKEKPGVYFFYLGASNWFASKAAKSFFKLPYYFEKINLAKTGDIVNFELLGKLVCQYKVKSKPFLPRKGSLDEWLVERYCLYTVCKQGISYQCNIVHSSWVLYDAEVMFHQNNLLSLYNIIPESNDPIVHFSKKSDVAIWPLIQEK